MKARKLQKPLEIHLEIRSGAERSAKFKKTVTPAVTEAEFDYSNTK